MEMDEDKSEFCPKVTLEKTDDLPPVAAHTAVVYKGCLLVHGGHYYKDSNLVYKDPSELLVYPYGTGDFGVWLKIKCGGDVPRETCGTCALINGDSMYLFGGSAVFREGFWHRRTFPTSALYKLDLITGLWELVNFPKEEKVPTPRDKMAGWSVGKKLYFFGGYGSPLRLLRDPEIYLFDDEHDYKEGAERGVWNNQLLEFDTESSKWRLLPKLGDVPPQRAACGAAYVPDLNAAFIFGGRHYLQRLNDLYRLDMFTMQWERIEPEGQKPVGRSWCSFTHLAGRRVIVMQGGYSDTGHPLDDIWHLDLEELYDPRKSRDGTARVRWICVREATIYAQNMNEAAIREAAPYLRYWHTANVIDSPLGNLPEAMLLYGGYVSDIGNPNCCINSLSTQRLQPSSLFTIAMSKLQRDQLLPLPPEFSVLNLKRKVILLEELSRFKQKKSSYMHLSESHHYANCPSVHGLSLGEVFDILDPVMV